MTVTVPLKYQVPGVVNRKDLAGRTVLVVDDSPFAGETTNVPHIGILNAMGAKLYLLLLIPRGIRKHIHHAVDRRRRKRC